MRSLTAFEFDLIIDRDPTAEDDADRLFEAFDAAGFTITPGVSTGPGGPVASIPCYVEAGDLDESTLEGAIRRAIGLARGLGFDVVRVEVEPDTVTPNDRSMEVPA